MEILVVILVFVLPLVSVLLDKKKRNIPKVKSKRIVWPDGRPADPLKPGTGRPVPGPQAPVRQQAAAQEDQSGTHVFPGAGSSKSTGQAKAGKPAAADAMAAATAFMSSARSTRTKAEESQSDKKKEYTEKQKLIIYSEILKPKFDE